MAPDSTTAFNNLSYDNNVQKFETPEEMYDTMRALTDQKNGNERVVDYTVRNFFGVIPMMPPPTDDRSFIENELFQKTHLLHYTSKNLGDGGINSDLESTERGAGQGDYSYGMKQKIENVVRCLKVCRCSKRAVLPIPFARVPSAQVNFSDKAQTKCMRELIFYLEKVNNGREEFLRLCCTGFFRMQNANIFPKNLHFICALMDKIAKELEKDEPWNELPQHVQDEMCRIYKKKKFDMLKGLKNVKVGSYSHFITSLCYDRNATHC